MQHMLCDTWHLTCDMWHVVGVNILSKSQLPSSYGLGGKVIQRSGGKGWPTELSNEWMSDEGVCRTAPATPGLLITCNTSWMRTKAFMWNWGFMLIVLILNWMYFTCFSAKFWFQQFQDWKNWLLQLWASSTLVMYFSTLHQTF